jgi:hypothetical protein
MTWRGRLVLSVPFVIAATLNVLDIIARPLHWRAEHIDGYCFLFGTPWGWLLDNGWIGSVNSKWLDGAIAYSVILWIPALLYSGCLWLVIWSRSVVVRYLHR